MRESYRGLLFLLFFFYILVLPLFLLCGFDQDEINAIYKKCLVADFKDGPIFSDDWCGKSLAERNKYLFFETISQPLPPQYSIEIGDIRVPIYIWFHASSIVYNLQDLMLYLAEKIDRQNFTLKLVFVKLPGLLFSSLTLVALYILAKIFGVSPLVATGFTLILGIFIFASGVGIGLIYTFTFLILTLSLVAFFRRRFLLFFVLVFIGVYFYLPSAIFFASFILSVFLLRYVSLRFLLLSGLVIALAFLPYTIPVLDFGMGQPEIFGGILQSNILSLFLISKKLNQAIFSLCSENVFCFLIAKFILFFEDLFGFFSFYGTGVGLLLNYVPPSNILYYLPSIPFIFIFVIFLSVFRKLESEGKIVGLSILIFFIFQLVSFPFGLTPRRMGLILPFLSLLPALMIKSTVIHGRKYYFSVFLLLMHFIGQFFIYYNMVKELISYGRFDFCVDQRIQRELAKKIEEDGEDKFVNISGVVNFQILFSNDSKIPDYGYYFGFIRDFGGLEREDSRNSDFKNFEELREDFAKKKLKDIMLYHRGKKFIFQDASSDFIFSADIFSLGIRISSIPERNPIYYIVELE